MNDKVLDPFADLETNLMKAQMTFTDAVTAILNGNPFFEEWRNQGPLQWLLRAGADATECVFIISKHSLTERKGLIYRLEVWRSPNDAVICGLRKIVNEGEKVAESELPANKMTPAGVAAWLADGLGQPGSYNASEYAKRKEAR